MDDIEFRPVIIPKATYDLLLKQNEPLGLIALYNFYYYTAVWQKTNQPKAVTSYAAKGLKISSERIRRYKKTLIKLGLIKNKVTKNDKGRIIGHYIKVKYYAFHPTGKPEGGKNQRVVNQKGNTYSNNRRNAYSNNTVIDKSNDGVRKSFIPKTTSKSFDAKCSSRLESVLRKKRRIYRKVNKANWAKTFKKFRTENNLKKKEIKEVLSWYIKHFGEQYVPKAYSAEKFCEKFADVQYAMEQKRTESLNDSDEYTPPIVKKRKVNSR